MLYTDGLIPEELLSSKSLVSLLITAILAAPLPVPAQEVSGPKSALVQQPAGSLTVVVLQGEGAVNRIKSRSATPPVVQVRDQNEKPVAGAEVVFQLPAAGPGGVFHGWMRNQTAKTNAQGQAGATGFTPNDEEGRFNIKVTASQGNRTGSTVIAQSNTNNGSADRGSRSSRRGLWIVLGVVAAGALAGGIYAATRGNGDSAATAVTNPITITPGPVTVAGPR